MKVKRFTLDTRHWGPVKMLRPIPSEERVGDLVEVDPWGGLAPLREHPDFAINIPVVSGEVYSQAMHGYAKPLLEALGREPRFQLKTVPGPYRVCAIRDECIMHDAGRCSPGKKLPECWQPEGSSKEALRAMALVMLAWAEDRYVVVVEGGEYSL